MTDDEIDSTSFLLLLLYLSGVMGCGVLCCVVYNMLIFSE